MEPVVSAGSLFVYLTLSMITGSCRFDDAVTVDVTHTLAAAVCEHEKEQTDAGAE